MIPHRQSSTRLGCVRDLIPPQSASSRDRLVAAATAFSSSASIPSGAISTSSAARVVPPGLVTASRKAEAGSLERPRQLARARDRREREARREIGRQARGDAGLGQASISRNT